VASSPKPGKSALEFKWSNSTAASQDVTRVVLERDPHATRRKASPHIAPRFRVGKNLPATELARGTTQLWERAKVDFLKLF
jgi:hypothetical protein